MKNFLSNKKTTIIFLVITVLLLGVYTYMLFRPISYGMGYTNTTVYEEKEYQSDITFNADTTMNINNDSFEQGHTARYYYKNGYVFNIVALTDEDYEKEVEYINNNFEIAVKEPFYANEINAFKMTAVSMDDYTLVYTCKGAIVIAVVGGVVELALIGLTVASFLLCKKSKKK